MSFIDDSFNDYYNSIKTKGNCVASKYSKLWKAIKISEKLTESDLFEEADFDDPNEQICVHGCTVKLTGKGFHGENVDLLADFIKSFDSVSLIDDDGVNISALLDGVYEKSK